MSHSNCQSSSRVAIRKQNYKNEFLTIRIEICFRNPGFNVKWAIDISLRLLFHYFREYFSKQNCLTSRGGRGRGFVPQLENHLHAKHWPNCRHVIWKSGRRYKTVSLPIIRSTMLSLPIPVTAPSKRWVCARRRVCWLSNRQYEFLDYVDYHIRTWKLHSWTLKS